jgi:hypothetical protein
MLDHIEYKMYENTSEELMPPLTVTEKGNLDFHDIHESTNVT